MQSMTRYALFCEYNRTAFRREDIVKTSESRRFALFCAWRAPTEYVMALQSSPMDEVDTSPISSTTRRRFSRKRSEWNSFFSVPKPEEPPRVR